MDMRPKSQILLGRMSILKNGVLLCTFILSENVSIMPHAFIFSERISVMSRTFIFTEKINVMRRAFIFTEKISVMPRAFIFSENVGAGGQNYFCLSALFQKST